MMKEAVVTIVATLALITAIMIGVLKIESNPWLKFVDDFQRRCYAQFGRVQRDRPHPTLICFGRNLNGSYVLFTETLGD